MEATAHHEAGHAVAALLRKVRFHIVTVLPTQDAAGHIVYLRPCRSTNQMHNRGMVALAGEAAQRRHSPHSVRRFQGSGDREAVVRFALACVGSIEQANLLVRLWSVQAREFAEVQEAAIDRVARALMDRGTLTESDCRSVMTSRRYGHEPSQ